MDKIMKEHKDHQKKLVATGGLFPDDILQKKEEKQEEPQKEVKPKIKAEPSIRKP